MWLSRAAFEALESAHQVERDHLQGEIAWLRAQLADATAHNRRMDRVDRHLPEREPRERVPDEPMPAKLQRVVALFGDTSARAMLESSITKARQAHESWDEIYERTVAELPPGMTARLGPP